jgi:hypothetical protein
MKVHPHISFCENEQSAGWKPASRSAAFGAIPA